MEFNLRTILILLSIVVTGIMISFYALVINVTEPLAHQMPTGVNIYAAGNEVSRESWVVNRAHLAQTIIARQVHHDVLLYWPNHGYPGVPITHQHLTMRLHFVTPTQFAAASSQVQLELESRGGIILLHPLRDSTTDVAAHWDQINNAIPNRRVNVVNVRGQAGMHYNVIDEFLERHPNPANFPQMYVPPNAARSFRITQFQHDNGEAFFFIQPES